MDIAGARDEVFWSRTMRGFGRIARARRKEDVRGRR